MNQLENIFNNLDGNVVHKWKHYFEIYERHFSKFKNQSPTIVEIGIFQGGSLELWEQYFGKGVKIYGVDINPSCKKFERENVEVLIGSQEDPVFLEKLKQIVQSADIIIDDGGHTMSQLKTSFKHLFSLVKDGGIYLAEDLHTCYWYMYDGGVGRKSNFIEYSKKLIDEMHLWYYNKENLTEYTKTITGIHFYDSIIVFDKGVKEKPYDVYSGNVNHTDILDSPPKNKYFKQFKYLLHKYTSINIP